MPRRVLLLNVAALSAAQIGERTPRLRALADAGALTPLVPPLGALTCPAHATMLTGVAPGNHGIVANGWYDRSHARVFNWNRSRRMIAAPTLLDTLRERSPDATAAWLFWRFAAHSGSDLLATERPTYWASGRKSFDVFVEPGSRHAELIARHGPFPFPRFWGPLAGFESTEWILAVTSSVLADDAPTLTLSYAPFLDYDAQRHGPDDPRSLAALGRMDAAVGEVLDGARSHGVDVAVVSDYGFRAVSRAVHPNRVLRRAGLIAVHDAANGEVLEPGSSRAFAVCDNQIAHVYVQRPADIDRVRELLAGTDGIARVLTAAEVAAEGAGHARAGDLVALAEPDAWFAYPYWVDERKAPDFARCIAIFDKPGFDPCELNAPPGVGGKLHLGKRVLQKKAGIAVPFDVIDPDATRIRGARNSDRTDHANGALLITSWARDSAASARPMESVHDVVLSRILGD